MGWKSGINSLGCDKEGEEDCFAKKNLLSMYAY